MDTLTHKCVICLFLLVASLPVMVQANETSKSFSLETIQHKDGFMIQQPTISTGQLQIALNETERFIENKTRLLEKDVNEHREAGNNLVLAAIMPGGMLYLAYHKGQQSAAEDELASMQAAELELQKDVVRLALDKPVTIHVASYP